MRNEKNSFGYVGDGGAPSETKDSIVSRKARDYATSAPRDGYCARYAGVGI